MSKRMRFPQFQKCLLVALVAAASIVAVQPAGAVQILSGSIATDGVSTTIDRFYLTVTPGNTTGNIGNAITNGGPPLTIARPGLAIYQDTGSFTSPSLVALVNATSPNQGASITNLTLAPGNYVVVASEFPLSVGVAGPFQLGFDPATQNAIYEVGVTGSLQNFISTCSAQGNLNGTFTLTSYQGTSCPAITGVPEPGSSRILVAVLAILAAVRGSVLCWRRKTETYRVKAA